MASSLRIDSDAFERSLEQAIVGLKLSARKEVTRLGIRVQNNARRRAPVDTGELRASIRAVDGMDARGPYVDVGTNVDHAKHMEYGTRPHVIEPKTKQALYWKGARHPVKRVMHPGTAPRPFHRPAVLEEWINWHPTISPRGA